jgi:putative ABC transport system permease protein
MQIIPELNLALAFVPVIIVLIIMARWSLSLGDKLVALARMLIQLIVIGYALTWIFALNSSAVVLLILTIMLFIASSIALRPLSKDQLKRDYWRALVAISVGGGFTLVFLVIFVLQLKPWYQANTIIPLAGMIFASAMNTVSVAAERFSMELKRDVQWLDARNQAFTAGLIPIFNSLLAVGLVTLPGMMTGQILSGVSPLIAVRYQIVVMCMLTGASGISVAIFLFLQGRRMLNSGGTTDG